MARNKLVVGLTGGIASGKSLIATLFYDRGASKIDADALVNIIYESNPILQGKLLREYGSGVFTPHGKVDKQKLGDLVFSDPKKLSRLEEIVWPYVTQEIEEYIAVSDGIIIVEAARLYEAGYEKRYNNVIVVECPPDIQIKRLVDKRGMSQEKAGKIVNLQRISMESWPQSDYLITNDKEGVPPDYGGLQDQVEEVWNDLLQKLYFQEHFHCDTSQ